MNTTSRDSRNDAPLNPRSAVLFAAAVFVSAFLLFQIQPLISKAILPWFGGTPGVWTTCMLFFQLLLFGGYAYAHLLSSRVPVRGQVIVHVVLIGVALVPLKVLPEASWKPVGDVSPVARIVMLLGATVGLPYFLLATTGPLLQRWFSLAHSGSSPYRLYALSNAGSLIALLTYPFVFEPVLALRSQARLWSIGFSGFAILCAACGIRLWRHVASTTPAAMSSGGGSSGGSPSGGRYILWFLLAMTASTMYLATTNAVCQDVAVVPFLWVVPLSLYLLSFILCFESDTWYRRRWWALASAVMILAISWGMAFSSDFDLPTQVAVYFGAMFAVCMTCHGEVARLRPDPQYLTAFYLTLAAGGAGGGLFVALLAPAVFPNYWELNLCLLAALMCACFVLVDETHVVDHAEGDPSNASHRRSSPRGLPLIPVVLGVALMALVGTVFVESISNYRRSIAMTRNFYGVLEVETDELADALVLRHGRIIHGVQLRNPRLRMTPTAYYSTRSGVARAIQVLQTRKPSLRIGLVGLGVGTLAAYGREGDVFRFYEINEDVVRHAREQFSFLSASRAEIEVVLGDARLSLASEPSQEYDLLVLDAFSGDAIPTHLLTREAFSEFMRHVVKGGIIAVHISNLHLNLQPVVAALADEHALHTTTIFVPEIIMPVDASSEWVLMARDPAVLDAEPLRLDVVPPQQQRVLWTDDFSNLFQVLR